MKDPATMTREEYVFLSRHAPVSRGTMDSKLYEWMYQNRWKHREVNPKAAQFLIDAQVLLAKRAMEKANE